MAMKTLYIILDREGNIKVRRKSKNGTGSVYSVKAEAIRQAKHPGDSVVPVPWDTNTQPVHIKEKRIDPDKDEQL